MWAPPNVKLRRVIIAESNNNNNNSRTSRQRTSNVYLRIRVYGHTLAYADVIRCSVTALLVHWYDRIYRL